MRGKGCPILEIGDISRAGGLDTSAHETHEDGKAFDMRPIRNDGKVSGEKGIYLGRCSAVSSGGGYGRRRQSGFNGSSRKLQQHRRLHLFKSASLVRLALG